MGKLTDALKKAAEERLLRLEKLDNQNQVRFEFIAQRTVDSKIDPRIITFYDLDSPVTEQYRTLRTNIQAINTPKPVRTITLTSSIHGEGKTISAINLALSMARESDNKRILLIDADMRRSRIGKYLGIKTEGGLAEILSEGRAIDDFLLNITGVDNLTVMPAGKPPRNPAELLSSVKFRNLLSRLKTRYDYIIFDTPPIIPVTDTGLIGSHTDGVIMVVQASRTQRGVVKHSEGLLKQAQSKILGYILTNIQYHIPAYIYRYL